MYMWPMNVCTNQMNACIRSIVQQTLTLQYQLVYDAFSIIHNFHRKFHFQKYFCFYLSFHLWNENAISIQLLNTDTHQHTADRWRIWARKYDAGRFVEISSNIYFCKTIYMVKNYAECCTLLHSIPPNTHATKRTRAHKFNFQESKSFCFRCCELKYLFAKWE